MSLASQPGMRAFLALWNGVSEDALVPEYEAWHAFEHVPERVGSPGFVGGTRYVSAPDASGQPAYFTLYALEGTEALRSARYQELLDQPTDWSARMRGVLCDFRREPCALLSAHGASVGAHLATLQLRVATDVPGVQCRVTRALDDLVAAGDALHACWGRVDGRSVHPLSQASASGDEMPLADAGFDAVVLLQHLRHDPLLAAVQRLLGALGPVAALRAPVGRYEMQTLVRQADLPHPLERRQPPRPDLREPFKQGDPRP